jgi:hypothetical protein
LGVWVASNIQTIQVEEERRGVISIIRGKAASSMAEGDSRSRETAIIKASVQLREAGISRQ